jgi:hypothetical protein
MQSQSKQATELAKWRAAFHLEGWIIHALRDRNTGIELKLQNAMNVQADEINNRMVFAL